LSKLKLTRWKLDDAPRPLRGLLRPSSGSVSSPLTLVGESLCEEDDAECLRGAHVVHGTLMLTNTVEAFEALQRDTLLGEEGRCLEEMIAGGDALRQPARLSRFLLICFANLKTHQFRYWFAFPALQPSQPAYAPTAVRSAGVQLASEAASWLVDHPEQPAWLLLPEAETKEQGAWRALPLAALPAVLRSGADFIVAFNDPASDDNYPGWPLRNLLVALGAVASASLGGSEMELDVMRVRSSNAGRVDPQRSLLLAGVRLPLPAPLAPQRPATGRLLHVYGWERNCAGELSAREADMRLALDASARAEEAVSLNSLLMRWRLAPELDTEKLASARFLLLGAGTLGCVSDTALAFTDEGPTLTRAPRPCRPWRAACWDTARGG
jgi:ubiquitin-like modifier-activating enzyme ATG7